MCNSCVALMSNNATKLRLSKHDSMMQNQVHKYVVMVAVHCYKKLKQATSSQWICPHPDFL